jgi:membrane-associated protease RseP (regulator of RpoE activity)
MTDETPQPEGEPSAASPEEHPTEGTKPFTYDDAVKQSGGDEDDVAPAPAAATPPTAPDAEPTQAAPVAGAAAPPTAAAPGAAAPAAERPAGIFIPKWVGLVAAAIIAALIFGGIGYAIGDSGGSDSQNATNTFPSTNGNGNGTQTLPNGGQFPGYGNGQFPNFPGNGNGNGNGGTGNGNGSGNGNSSGGSTTSSNAGFLGVAAQTTSDGKGVQVTDVGANSPAAKAGLQKGDVITQIDGNDITNPVALRNAIQAKQSGDTVSVTYTRNGSSNTVKVTLISRAEAQSN